MPPVGRWQRFKLSRWYPVFWLVIFIGLFMFGAGYYYIHYIIGPVKNTQATPTPTTSQTPLSSRLKIDETESSIVASDQYTKSTELTITLEGSDGQPQSADGTVIVTLSSSAQTGLFEAGSSAEISPGTSSLHTHYTDTKSGIDTITAFVSGLTPVTTTVTIRPAEASKLRAISVVPQNTTTLPALTDETFSTTVIDAYDNSVAGGKVVWTQVGTSNTREVESGDDGQSFFVANFAASTQPYSAIVRATFGQSTQNAYLTIQP